MSEEVIWGLFNTCSIHVHTKYKKWCEKSQIKKSIYEIVPKISGT